MINIDDILQKTSDGLDRLDHVKQRHGEEALLALVDIILDDTPFNLPPTDIRYVFVGDVILFNGDLVIYNSNEYEWDGKKWTKY